MDKLKGIVVLAVISLFSAASLAVMYDKTLSTIEENQRQFERKAVRVVFEWGQRIDEKAAGDLKYFEVFGEGEKLLGYAILGNGGGYQGNIGLLLGVTPDLRKCVGIYVVDSNETPGLGARIVTDEKWRAQFKDADLTQELKVVKGGAGDSTTTIDSITGATISSKAVVSIVNSTMKEARELLLEHSSEGGT